MVLECAIAALKRMNQSAMITIHTDCHYFADGQRRLAAWKNNGWKRSDGKELRNLDLWQEIEELLRLMQCSSISKMWSFIKMKMNATRVRQNGRLRAFRDKKVDNNQKTRFYWGKSRVSGCGNRILKDRFTKNVRRNLQKQPSNMDKVQEKMRPRKEKKMFEKIW